ncbi:MAG: hypothetical protein U5L75_01390 [Candidatus Campbellbacteria bacterium]|nr:hypothetical protein [Candidatus Campbellbacteria bacterium]
MKEFFKGNTVIVLALLLPLLLVLVIFLTTYLPYFSLSSDYNFVYATCENNTRHEPGTLSCDEYLDERFSIVNKRISDNELDEPQDEEGFQVRFFMHNTSTNESREIAFEEARSYELSSLLTAPDGVSFSGPEYDGGVSFFLFYDSNSSSGYYLTKGGRRQKQNLINVNANYRGYYGDGFRFMGWILAE